MDAAPVELGELEVGAIDVFVGAVRLLGMPKSVGEIYGLLYMARDPLPLDGIMGRLQMSKGSASQGLKFLRSVGAVRPVYVAGERRDYFEAVVELKQLVAGFIREELMPHMEHGAFRLNQLSNLADEKRDDPFVQQRVSRLKMWHKNAGEALPLVNKLIDQFPSA